MEEAKQEEIQNGQQDPTGSKPISRAESQRGNSILFQAANKFSIVADGGNSSNVATGQNGESPALDNVVDNGDAQPNGENAHAENNEQPVDGEAEGNANPEANEEEHHSESPEKHADGEEGQIDGEAAPQENAEEDGMEEVEVSVDEELTAEDIIRMKEDGEIAWDADEETIPKTKKVRKLIKRKKEESPQKIPDGEEEKDEFINYVKEFLSQLDKFNPGLWTSDHSGAVRDFFRKPSQVKLFFWIDQNGLKYSTLNPPELNASKQEHSS